ncbi:MAG: hypothetical protein LBD30_01685 [Verrucomicrobiales bacterium]|nr:hypothetical protein [Verrucomicrobiales bacterium]
MSSWLLNLGVCALTLTAAFACLQNFHAWVRRIGVWLVFTTLGLGTWFVSNSWPLVIVSLSCWFLIPLAQAVYMSRTLRFSRKSALTPGNLTGDDLEKLQPLTAELRELDFVLDRDYWLEPSPVRRGFRLFHHRTKPIYAAISIIKQYGMALFYLQLVTNDANGNFWITWDFPLTCNMKMPPQLKIYRCLGTQDTAELLAQHEAYLQINEVRPSVTGQTPAASLLFNHLHEMVIGYNLNTGTLRRYPRADDEIGYSWHGTWYISRKLFWELMR